MKRLVQNVCAAVVAVILLSTPAIAAGFQDGKDAYDHKDYGTAMEIWTNLAEDGDVKAQHKLGQEYYQLWYDRQYLSRDYQKARKYFAMAAQQGDFPSMYYLGRMYMGGGGMAQDYVMAHMFMNIAYSCSGHADAGSKKGVLEQQMTGSQITKAQKKARKYVCN